MKDSVSAVYEFHHQHHREPGFTIMEKERSQIFAEVIGTGKKIIDIGCRDGALTKSFLTGNTVIGLDIDTNALEQARQLGVDARYADLNGDWQQTMPVDFDVAVAGEVLEHLYYPDQVLKKITSVLKPKGVLIGTIPNAFNLKNRLRYLKGSKRFTPLSDPTHINHFTAAELEGLMKMHFNEVEIRGLGRHAALAKWNPGWFAFDLLFIGRNPKKN
ncbi:MAG: class I SAM-dependent methyltransferase [Candidatus Buchananbacteria bacterium]|nr:class I SAM-dependent methyltransferase [Candidatus Buchananbacteria bacterium]